MKVKDEPRFSYFNGAMERGENKNIFKIKNAFGFRYLFMISSLCFYKGADWVWVLEKKFFSILWLTFIGNICKFYRLPKVSKISSMKMDSLFIFSLFFHLFLNTEKKCPVVCIYFCMSLLLFIIAMISKGYHQWMADLVSQSLHQIQVWVGQAETF